MRVPLSWLSEFIEIDIPVAQIADLLTSAGIEVDAIEKVGARFNGVVVGEVMSVEQHPNADKLRIARVYDGNETVQVVCGAENCRTGLKSAFAPAGAELFDPEGKPFKIKKGKLRGVESFGMLCAADELGLSETGDGIMELNSSLKPGTDLSQLYSDVVLEVSLTPNLGHCHSILGIARELSALTGKKIKTIDEQLTESNEPNPAKVAVEDKKLCPRYTCRVVKNVKVGPSPDWMQKRLTAAGLRPINNIVDITNYVLLELGQPLHAFDLDKLDGKEIIVRTAKENETFTTLDGKDRKLFKNDLLICDAKKPVAIAGIMGGSNSEVSDSTKNILIESAYFDPIAIRISSQKLALQTDASRRFERGADPHMALTALNRAADLMAAIAGGTIAKGIIDQKTSDFPNKKVLCRLSRTNQLLGIQLSSNEIESIFKKLGLEPSWDGQDTFTISVPPYRHDITIEVDLIEEVARLYGLNNIPKGIASFKTSLIPDSPLYIFEQELRERLRAEGMQEFMTCDLVSPSLMSLLQQGEMPKGSVIRVLNPTSEDQSILRTSLLPGLLGLVKYNQDHQVHDICGFEIGRVYYKNDKGYGEQPVIGMILSGKKRPHEWDHPSENADFFDLKGILENLMAQLGIENYSFVKSCFHTLHSGRQASLLVDKLELATFGEVHPSILRQLDIQQRVLFAEINIPDLMQKSKVDRKLSPVPKFPCSERDWTLTLDEHAPIGEIIEAVQKIPSKLLEEISLLYLYRSDKIGKDRKNATFHFTYRDPQKTISQEAVETEHARIIGETMKTLKIKEV